jgi:hypothetical protein
MGLLYLYVRKSSMLSYLLCACRRSLIYKPSAVVAYQILIHNALVYSRTRGISSGFSATMCYVLRFAACKTYLDMEGSLQIYGSFLIFTAINVLGFIIVYWIAPVTEGKSLVEIEKYFSGETRS